VKSPTSDAQCKNTNSKRQTTIKSQNIEKARIEFYEKSIKGKKPYFKNPI
jgi:hypothetical protein